MIDDLLHYIWGAVIALVVMGMVGTAHPLAMGIVAVVVVLPREMEQTRNSILRKHNGHFNWELLKEHANGWDYWKGKLRDLAGFALGAIATTILIG